MYDILYVNSHLRQVPVQRGVHSRDAAAGIARREAQRRGGIGRMFLPGSQLMRECVVVVPAGRQLH